MVEFLSQNPLVILIGACEVFFWVFLLGGLAVRYVLRRRRLSAVLLVGVPVLDVVLVSASLLDVAGGSAPGATHGLAAVYLGFTVAFGHSVVRWVDGRFAYRFAGAPAPAGPPRYGTAKVVHEWRGWGRLLLGWGIALAVLAATALVAGTGIPDPTTWPADPMWGWGSRLLPVVLIWFAVGPGWTTLAPPREPARA